MRGVSVAPLALLASLAAQSHNSLLLIADDVGVDAIAAYRESTTPPPTPNIDALARSGVLFRQCWATPLCSPTRATLLTGRYGFRNGVGQVLAPGEPGLSYAETLLPEILRPAQIRDALIGKWHLGERSGDSTPNVAGFSHFAGAIGAALPSYTSWPKVMNGAASTSTAYATTFEVNEALSWIATHAEPWCVIVSFHAGHTPLHAPPASLHSQNLAGLSPSTTPGPFYRAMVEAMDREIGRLLASLPAAVRARTNVLLLGDNGTTGNVTSPPFPTGHAKGTLYQGGIRVPLIASGPAVSGGGREVGALVQAVDLFATIGELHKIDVRAAVPAATPLDCVSLVPYLKSASQAPLRTHAYSELFQSGTTSTPQQHGWTIRDARYKLIRWTDRTPPAEAFFDLVADAFEQNDLSSALTAAQRLAYEGLKLQAARLRGEPLTLGYGNGCSGRVGVPTVSSSQGPRRGVPFVLTLGSLAPAVTTAFCALGGSRDQFGLVALPYDLGPAGMPGCLLNASLGFVQSLAASGGKATWSLAIPNSPALLGADAYFQALVPETAANALGMVVSAGLLVVIG